MMFFVILGLIFIALMVVGILVTKYSIIIESLKINTNYEYKDRHFSVYPVVKWKAISYDIHVFIDGEEIRDLSNELRFQVPEYCNLLIELVYKTRHGNKLLVIRKNVAFINGILIENKTTYDSIFK